MHKKDNKGFTIIEVLIVLAIAGLILLIVFLAVPALQRNSRNTQYRNDVAAYLGAVNEWSTNNNGKVPVAADLTATGSGINALANVGTMTEPTTVATGARTNSSNPVGIGVIEIVTGAKCSTTATGETIASSGRAFAVRFSVESTGSGVVPQCTDS